MTLFCFFNFNVSASSILPVKAAWVLDEELVVVLREDGALLFANSIDSQKAEFTEENVSDFYGSYYNGTMSGVILYENGNIATINGYIPTIWNYRKNSEYEVEIVASNAKEIYSLPYFSYAYIDKNSVLKGKYNGNSIVVMENVRNCYDNTNYVITTDDKLYEFEVEKNTVTKTEIMTNVKDIKPANNDLLILRNNGDLYLCKKTETPNRIGTNVEDMTKVVVRDTWVKHYEIQYVNKNGEYFAGTAISDMKKYMENVREIYLYEDSAYALTCDNILYRFRQYYFDLNRAEKTYNVKKMLGDNDYLVLKTDNKVYAIKNVYKKDTYITDNVKDVIIYEGSAGLDDDRYLFIKNDGSIYGAYGDDNFVPKTPFITSFCQKPTKVIINNKNIELTAKIQMVNNRSMYPFRECLENMGATVLWDNVNQIAIGEYNGITIEFPIGRNEYWINGVKHEMDTTSYIDNSIGRTYIPIRFAAEGLGFTVEWTEGELENTISIHK